MDTIKRNEKRSFSNTISAGFKSIRGKGRTFYNIEFKNSTQLHRAGSSKEIIVDYIEIGRSPKCQIKFGEDCQTVSRSHCAIIKEGNDYFVKHLSSVNPTLINGKPVANKWYLHSGDEIQLSYGGPVIGFNIPANNFTNSIPLTRRLSLFREQAMRPYKRAIAILSTILLLTISSFIYYAIIQSKKMEMAENVIAETKKVVENLNDTIKKTGNIITDLQASQAESYRIIKKIKNQILEGYNNKEGVKSKGSIISVSDSNSKPATTYEKLFPSVFYIYAVEVEVIIDGERKRRDGDWSGTGFLLNDGRFVTARHVIEPWYYAKLGDNEDDNKTIIFENLLASSGSKVNATFKAISSSGQELSFSSDDFDINRSDDTKEKIDIEQGSVVFTRGSFIEDWAVTRLSNRSDLGIDPILSKTLPMGTNIFTLGFPYGMGASKTEIAPRYSNFTVSASGLSNGLINISGTSFSPGNSGGPVFFKNEENYSVVGIVSAHLGTQGFIIPINKIK